MSYVTGHPGSVRAAALGVTILAMAFSMPGAAQTSWGFELEWEQAGGEPSHYELCVDGRCQPLGARPVSAGRWRAPLPRLAPGEYRLVVRACGAGTCVAGEPDLYVRVLSPNPRRPPIDILDGPRIPVDRP
jgi:hypothetical protein